MKLKYYDHCGEPHPFQKPDASLRRKLRTRFSIEAKMLRENESPSADSFVRLGSILGQLRHFHSTAQCLQKALDIDPKHIPARVNLGLCFMAMGKYKDAFNLFDALVIEIAGRPDDFKALSDMLVLRGAARAGSFETDAAHADFLSAILCNPSNANALRNAGEMLIMGGNVRKAQHYLEAAARINPDDDTLHVLASIYHQLGRVEDGENLASEVIRRNESLKPGIMH